MRERIMVNKLNTRKHSNAFFKYQIKGRLCVGLFLLPVMLPMLLFWIYPILKAVWISFTNWDYMSPQYQFVGFRNYSSLLKSTAFSQALRNTLYFGIITVIPTLLLGFCLAVLVNRMRAGRRLCQFILLSPWVTPAVAVSLVWLWIYNPDTGFANMLLETLHLPALKWIHSSKTSMLSVAVVTVWKSVGYAMIFYITAFGRIPSELLEAARVDGANRFQVLKCITIPLVSPTTLFLAVISTINSLQAYDQIQILTQGGPAGSTRTLLYLYYQLGFEQFQMGEASAAAIVLIVITAGLSAVQFWISDRVAQL